MTRPLSLPRLEQQMRVAQGRTRPPEIANWAYGVAVLIGQRTGETPEQVANRVLPAPDLPVPRAEPVPAGDGPVLAALARAGDTIRLLDEDRTGGVSRVVVVPDGRGRARATIETRSGTGLVLAVD
jgi:hypothetical protein